MRWFEPVEERHLEPGELARVPGTESSHLSRWICIYLRDFSLDVVCPQADMLTIPVVLVEDSHKRQIALCNAAARIHGISSGMSLDTAYALASDLIVKTRDESQEARTLASLAAWAMRFTSMVSLIEPDAIVLEVKGSERLFGGAECLNVLIEKDFKTLGYHGSLALAPTPTSAWLLARSTENGRFEVADAGNLVGKLANVGISHCGFSAKLTESLRSAGLRKFSDCCRMPRDGLARRVGPQVVRFIDRVLGKTADPRLPFEPPRSFKRRVSLPAPSQTVEPLLLCTHRFLAELTAMLRALSKAVSKLELELFYQKHESTRITVHLINPSRDAEHIQVLLSERLQRVILPEPVESVSLRVEDFTRLSPESTDFFRSVTATDENWQRLLERMRARLGDQAMYGLGLSDEHRPEKAWCVRETTQSVRPRGYPRAPRPLWLLPEPKVVKVHDGVPVIRGKLKLSPYRERIESGWWDGNDIARDYFVAKNPRGECFWIFKDRRDANRWYVHGVFS